MAQSSQSGQGGTNSRESNRRVVGKATTDIDDFGGNARLRKEWQTWGKIMSEDVLRTLAPALYADLRDGVDVGF